MINEFYIMALYLVLCFVTVPIRTIVQNRRDTNFKPFIISQLVYSFFWFATYAMGTILLVHFVALAEWRGIIDVIMGYTVCTTMGSTAMLFRQKLKDEKVKQTLIANQKKSKKHRLPYKPKKGAKVLN